MFHSFVAIHRLYIYSNNGSVEENNVPRNGAQFVQNWIEQNSGNF